METNRQRKIAELIQKDMAEILRGEIRKNNIKNIIISVTHVNVSSDLGIAKIYLSIFPNEKAKDMLDIVKSSHILIRHDLSQLVKNQLRRVPELLFYHDNTSERADNIEQALKGEDNPIKNPDLLISRKKS